MKWDILWWTSEQGDRTLEHFLSEGWKIAGVAVVPIKRTDKAVQKIVLLKRRAIT